MLEFNPLAKFCLLLFFYVVKMRPTLSGEERKAEKNKINISIPLSYQISLSFHQRIKIHTLT